ncbi:MAG TPA: GTP-binding protein [Burkholderiales bacterium]|jgi:G3E family GTPase|nr:GTP-binding protein [Burkholderiales bacterium]
MNPDSSSVDSRCPVSVITGFLGSGKTTLLNRILLHPAMSRAAVIINEFGEIGLDHLLVTTPNENMVLLNSGCLCCTVRGDLVNTLRELYIKRRDGEITPFDRVLVETTGLADPVPIMQTLITDAEIAPAFGLSNVIALVDAVNGRNQLDRNPESVKQATVADCLLITKTDLASEADVAPLRQRLVRINPGARILEVVSGAIDPDQLFTAGVNNPRAKAPEVERWLSEEAFAHAGSGEHSTHAHGGGGRHDAHIHSFSVYRDQPIPRAGLVAWLHLMTSLRGPDLLRVKGLLNVDGRPVVINAVQTLLHEPMTLDAWPSSDRRSRFVFITHGMDRATIEDTFAAFDLSGDTQARTLDASEYAKFMQVMGKLRR